MPNPLIDLPPALRTAQVLYVIRFTCPYDNHRFIHCMIMSSPRNDRTMLEHFKMRSADGKVVAYEISDNYDHAIAKAAEYRNAQSGYVNLPAGMESVTEADVSGAGRAKEDLLREMGLLSDKAEASSDLRSDLHPAFQQQVKQQESSSAPTKAVDSLPNDGQ